MQMKKSFCSGNFFLNKQTRINQRAKLEVLLKTKTKVIPKFVAEGSYIDL